MSQNPPKFSYSFGWFDWFCLWYPPGWLILFNRHWQHYKKDPDGWNWLEYLLFLIPLGFYLAWLLRWVRLGVRLPQAGSSIPDPAYQQAFRQEILAPILQHYFRGCLHQLEHLPPKGPLIVVMNHAGLSFPWDFVGLGLLLGQQADWFVQPLAHPMFFEHLWLRWWLPSGWAQVLGGVRADAPSFEQAIANKVVLLYAPEGLRGLTKGWQQRYQLATFDPSFVRLSIRYQVPILPVACVGNESLHPWAFNLRRVATWLKLPVFPVSPLMVPFALFPSMGIWAMRSRLRYYVQPVWCPWLEGDRQEGSQRANYQLAEGLRSRLQKVLHGLALKQRRR